MFRQQGEIEPATDLIQGRRVLTDVRSDKCFDEVGCNGFEIIIVQIRREAPRLKNYNGVERFSGNPRVEAHPVDDRVYRRESQVVEVEALPASASTICLKRVKRLGAGKRLDSTLAC